MDVATIEEHIDVDLPVRTVYNQWTQFEEFPRFMEGVQSVDQIDDTTVHWVAAFGGVNREWDAKITEQEPDMRIAWHSIDGPHNAGVVTFHELADDKTRVMLRLDFDPEGLIETIGDKLGFVKAQAKGDLKRFKGFVEELGSETGAWRGRVDQET